LSAWEPWRETAGCVPRRLRGWCAAGLSDGGNRASHGAGRLACGVGRRVAVRANDTTVVTLSVAVGGASVGFASRASFVGLGRWSGG
jgi:hypothetical protein